jgi:hypothetical protein
MNTQHETMTSIAKTLWALGPGLWSAGKASAQHIHQLEQALGCALPPTYKQFLAEFGAVGVGDSTVNGIVADRPLSLEGGSLFGESKRFEEEHDLPGRYLVLQTDEDAPYCFDTEAQGVNGEYSIVCFELHSRHVQEVAPSFPAWLAGLFALDSE